MSATWAERGWTCLGIALVVAVALFALASLVSCASDAEIAAWTAESDRQTVWCGYHSPACWVPIESWFPAYLADHPDGFRLEDLLP